MKKILLFILLFYVSNIFAAGDEPMVLVYNVDTGGIAIPIGAIVQGGAVTIDWGDGTDTTVNQRCLVMHKYANAGIDTVKISGDLIGFGNGMSSSGGSQQPLVSVLTWGNLPITSLSYAFNGAVNLKSVPPTLPTGVTDLSYMFMWARSFTSDLSGWDVTNVANMNRMFCGAATFNSDLSGWDVSNVADMKEMFSGARSFNSDLSGWNVSNVTNMSGMFSGATSFNGDVSRWDVSNVTNMRYLFNCAASFNGDVSRWNVSNVTDMSCMFRSARSFSGDVSSWNISNVTSFEEMFSGATSFNGDLSSWDVSNITNMSKMLDSTAISVTNYDNLLNGWEQHLDSIVLGVYGLRYSSEGESSRSKLINKGWTITGDALVSNTFTIKYDENYIGGGTAYSEQFSSTSRLISPSYRPQRAGYRFSAWNTKADGGGSSFGTNYISQCDTTLYANWGLDTNTVHFVVAGDTLKTQRVLYQSAAIAPTIASKEGYSFRWSSSFAHVTRDMVIHGNYESPMVLLYDVSIFKDFGVPIGGISPSGSVTIDWGDGTDTILYAPTFLEHTSSNSGIDTVKISGDLTRLGVEEAWLHRIGPLISVLSWGDLPMKSLRKAFHRARSLTTVPSTIPASVRDISSMFYEDSTLNCDLSGWDVSNITDMSYLFYQARAFTSDLSGWDVTNVINMNRMFCGATKFDSDLSGWNVTNVTDMRALFGGAAMFNSDLSGWDISKLSDFGGMFSGAAKFDSDLSGWDVSNVTSMGGLFNGAISFTSDLSGWDVSNVSNMGSMFRDADSFTSDLSGWDVSNVTDMGGMFRDADSFTSDLSGWDVSNVTDMRYMFSGAVVFNGDLSDWDVSNVDSLSCMFSGASSFSGDLSSWDVSKVIDMYFMFSGASSFNCDLSQWNISNVTEMRHLFDNTAMSVTNYNKLLKGWAVQNPQKEITFGAGGLLYNSDAVSARAALTNNKQWTIIGDSLVETLFTVTYDENYVGGVTTTTEFFSPAAKYVSPSYFPKREGYKLAGWNSKPDGSGYAFDTSAVIIDDITFYAQWDKGTAIIQTDTTALTGVKGLLVAPNPVPQNEEKVTLVIPSDLSGSWKIGVYDVLGNELDDATFEAQRGTTYEWDLRNKSGVKVGGGSYVIMAEHTDESGNVKAFRRTVGVAR